MSEVMSAATPSTPRQIPAEIDESGHSTRNGLLCALALAVSVLLIYPVANVPSGDDFSYTRTALEFARTGHFAYNGWATAMLGWLIPWGALFIKLFGFSFTAVRFSMLPIAMTTVYLFHQILRRFGITPADAVLGTLTMALSPLFLPLASTYMTDVPGLFVILFCIWMCQRAVDAKTDRTALLWLCFATLINVPGGTVRQIAWLGGLVIVPSTAWLLRERRGMKTAGVVLFALTFISVIACMHWFNQQPYSVPEHVFAGPIHGRMLGHLIAQLLKTLLCLLFVVLPVLIAWLPAARRLTRISQLRIVAAMMVVSLLAFIQYVRGTLDPLLMPWLSYSLEEQGMREPGVFGTTPVTLAWWIRLAISLLIVASALIFIERLASRQPIKLHRYLCRAESWKELGWILGPFSLSYVIMLMPRGTFDHIQDRYVLVLMPIAILVLLKLYRERVAKRLSMLTLVALIAFSAYGIGAAHNFFAESRALASTIETLQAAGVPRTSIQAGFASDGWVQIERTGYVNDTRIQVPAGAYRPPTVNLQVPPECRYWLGSITPAILPKYFVVIAPVPCFARTNYPPIHFLGWLPPFHRALYMQQLRPGSK